MSRLLVRLGRAIRDLWLIVGVTILLILLLESAYRTQSFVRRATNLFNKSGAEEPRSPFDGTAWASDYWRDHAREEEVIWAPYVYLRNPTFQGRYISVDSAGHRVTPQTASKGTRTIRVFFMGGSTTFGWFQRAEHTIPAEAGRRLQALLGDSARVEVTNFGVPGHTFTQEILELLLQLRAGARPDVVVFYDGINDVMATVQNGRGGFPQNESNRADDFIRGRELLAENPPVIADLRAGRRLVLSAMLPLRLVRRILALNFVQRLRAIKSPPSSPPEESLAHSIVHMHTGNARIVETLAASYGFQPIYIWQPALLSTHKRLTSREKWLHRRPPREITDLHMAVPALIGPAMAPIAGDRFIDATDIFNDDTLEVFVDPFGHTYERATPRIVDELMPALAAATSRVVAARSRGDDR